MLYQGIPVVERLLLEHNLNISHSVNEVVQVARRAFNGNCYDNDMYSILGTILVHSVSLNDKRGGHCLIIYIQLEQENNQTPHDPSDRPDGLLLQYLDVDVALFVVPHRRYCLSCVYVSSF